MEQLIQNLYGVMTHVQGYIYPNEVELHWGILIVLYPYITGLVAGAFILASLERVFRVKAVRPTYELALITALAFLLTAALPLVAHLTQPQRAYEIMITPNPTSAMAIFGFVYLWYLMVVILLEIWFDYRRDFVEWSRSSRGIMKWVYKACTLGVTDISPETLKWDDRLGRIVTIIGIPSAFLLHGYVGFIFGSIKANPWWSTVLMPVIFLFSAMVSGIALVMLLYMVISKLRRVEIDMKCLDTIGQYLLYALVLDFSLEILDQIHRFYEAEESFEILSLLMSGKLYITIIIVQVLMGTIIPLATLGLLQVYKPSDRKRRLIYIMDSALVLVGIFAMRWNVVIGGQLFSKSFYGFTAYKIELIGREGFLASAGLVLLPFLILIGLLWLMPPWKKQSETL